MEVVRDNRDKVLIVDDNPISYKLLEWWCKRWGYSYDVAVDGKEAIDKVTENDYDLVLLDIQLPDINGAELRNYIAYLRPELPVIYQSGYSMKETVKEVPPRDGYLQKPFLPDQLRDMMTLKMQREAIFSQTA